jgi:hypothetical protein
LSNIYIEGKITYVLIRKNHVIFIWIIMYETNLMAVQEDGQKLVMMDGTIWVIHPDDIDKAVNWVPPCGIQIDVNDVNLEYDYEITNTDEDIIVKAYKRR